MKGSGVISAKQLKVLPTEKLQIAPEFQSTALHASAVGSSAYRVIVITVSHLLA
jgi:hypothetical protein